MLRNDCSLQKHTLSNASKALATCVLVSALNVFVHAAELAESMDPLSTALILKNVEQGTFETLDVGDAYAIYDAGVKLYPRIKAIVQSSVKPISLGRPMREFTNTARLWEFVNKHNIKRRQESLQEIWWYQWVERAQGDMIFDVGIALGDNAVIDTRVPPSFMLKSYPPIKVAGLVYVGPFPGHPQSGWDEIRWEHRAKLRGFEYSEKLYREIYHRFDRDNDQNVVEIQITIK